MRTRTLRPTQFRKAAALACAGLGLLLRAAAAAELVQPPVCSAATATQPGLSGICSVKHENGYNNIKLSLTVASAATSVGGYKVTTENYNGNYLTPVVEAMPGDAVSARLVNSLASNPNAAGAHAGHQRSPTNLHYFHGGIVSPNNARPKKAEEGDGDNVYVHLKSGSSFEYKVPIPGKDQLDARVLETKGFIPHPLGLNWYHSHLHGISSNQVTGGMSGLLSVGEATANVNADCVKDPNDPNKCSNDVAKDTSELRSSTMARYALLRDMPLMGLTVRPDQANGEAAQWDPSDAARNFPLGAACGVWKLDGSGLEVNDTRLRTGFCQRSQTTALLFTLNGQLFPTITVDGGKNLLLRLGNLSANFPYWLELQNEADGTILPLTILSLDGVVPALPTAPGQTARPVKAVEYKNVVMMPATRADIYVRNDNNPHTGPQVYILRSKRQVVQSEDWPEVQLARIVLQPHAAVSKVALALNGPAATAPAFIAAAEAIAPKPQLPDGCARDLDPADREYRRVTFMPPSPPGETRWSILTEIVRPTGPKPTDEAAHMPADPAETTVGIKGDGFWRGIPFEEYVGSDGLVDWTSKKHVCIYIDRDQHAGSHKQLWVLFNATENLHNFHIHQMKFRFATAVELANYFIKPPDSVPVCDPGQCPDYLLYDDQSSGDVDPGKTRRWHDTIPVPPFGTVFLVMSFDAVQQIGRFVFHCHILKHEDNGLMAPIEVWGPATVTALQ